MSGFGTVWCASAPSCSPAAAGMTLEFVLEAGEVTLPARVLEQKQAKATSPMTTISAAGSSGCPVVCVARGPSTGAFAPAANSIDKAALEGAPGLGKLRSFNRN